MLYLEEFNSLIIVGGYLENYDTLNRTYLFHLGM